MLEISKKTRWVAGWIGLTSLALAGPPSAPPAAAPDEHWEKTNEQWFESIPAGGRVRVVNPFGNVYARFGGYEARVEILATIQQLDDGRPAPQVHRDAVESGIDVTVVDAEPGAAAAERRDRVDLVVFVPKGTPLEAETDKDKIEIKGLKSDVAARSARGDVSIRGVAGRVRAHSARGQISVALEGGATQEPQELSTETGDIEAYLWEDAAVEVRLATSGEISTDFSIQIEHHKFEEPDKIGIAVVGKGGPKLSLLSKRGHLRLLRLPRDFKPDGSEMRGDS
ncbi:MAG TPA: hypothetical protein VJS92_17790 [Candidatus Polarisedimenticolaceae bacterium]|nr:hypothetical protein [Candidatus Polarisedimenticolaceae bacterium]